MTLYCIGAGVFGLLLGYVFGWSTRSVQPGADVIAGLLGTAFGGTVLQLLKEFTCAESLPIYVIGLAVGFVVYMIGLKFSWPKVDHMITQHGLKRPTLFPWALKDPCCGCNHAPANNPHGNP